MVFKNVTNKTLEEMMESVFIFRTYLGRNGLHEQAIKLTDIELALFIEIRDRKRDTKLQQKRYIIEFKDSKITK